MNPVNVTFNIERSLAAAGYAVIGLGWLVFAVITFPISLVLMAIVERSGAPRINPKDI